MDLLGWLLWFRGRMGRLHYWLVVAAGLLLGVLWSVLTALYTSGQENPLLAALVNWLPILAAWLLFATVVKRAHDLGWSGWVALLLFVPVINLATLVVLGIPEGDLGLNQYGYRFGEEPAEEASTSGQ